MIGLLVKGFQERGAEVSRLEAEIERLKKASSEKDRVYEARLAKIEKALLIKPSQQTTEKSTQ